MDVASVAGFGGLCASVCGCSPNGHVARFVLEFHGRELEQIVEKKQQRKAAGAALQHLNTNGSIALKCHTGNTNV